MSGYSRDQARDITRSGILGYKRKWEVMPNRHRRGAETETSRRRKKMTGKTTWYLDKQAQRKDTPSNSVGGKRRRGKGGGEDESRPETHRQPSAVIFIERTPGGALVKEIREVEEDLSKIVKRRVKVMEKNGTRVQMLLTKADPLGH